MNCVLTRTAQRIALLLLMGILGSPAVQAQPTALPDTLTFGRATTLLLENNPQLRAARGRAQAESQTARAAALFPNPTLGVSEEHTPLPDGGADDEWFLSLSQPLNYPGEQQARQRSADAAQRAAEAALEETRASLYNELRHRYLAVVVAQTRHRVLQRYTEAIRQAARAGTVRFEEGDLGPIQRSRLKEAEAAFENDLAEAAQQRRTARTELASTIVPDGPTQIETEAQREEYAVPDSMPVHPITVDEQAALQAAVERRARLRAQQARVERERQSLDAARYRQYPDLSLSAGPKQLSTPGGTTVGFTAGLEVQLPLWNSGQTAVEAQEGRQIQAQATLDATRRAVEVQVQNALDRLTSYRTRLQAVSDSALRDTDTLLQDALFTYEQGELTLFELLDTIESARRTELLRIRLAAEYLRALYDLEAAIGVGPQDDPLVVEGALSPRDSAL